MQATQTGRPNEPNMLRRKLFRGASGGVGVLLAVHAKTALGTAICKSPSAMVSGNTSPRPPGGATCSGGLSPGYWKVPQHSGTWKTAGATFPKFSSAPVICDANFSVLQLTKMTVTGTTFSAAGFGVPGLAVVGNGIWELSIWSALASPGSFAGGGQLLRHLVAAWLNAGYFTTITAQYPLTRVQIIAMWNATKGGGTYSPGGGSVAWTANDVINYISGMYDLNASGPDPALCNAP